MEIGKKNKFLAACSYSHPLPGLSFSELHGGEVSLLTVEVVVSLEVGEVKEAYFRRHSICFLREFPEQHTNFSIFLVSLFFCIFFFFPNSKSGQL